MKSDSWTHEKEVLYKNYADKHVTGKINKKEKHAYEVLREQRSEHMSQKSTSVLKTADPEKTERILNAYNTLLKAIFKKK